MKEERGKEKATRFLLQILHLSLFLGPPPPKKIVHHGRTSTELYLHCYQFILWKQCYALIHTIGLPPELESVIKDLWALRLQLLKGRLSDPDQDGELLFTSQPEVKKSREIVKRKGASSNDEADDEKEEDNRRRENVKVRGRDMPILIESLGTCYLAFILLRLPISVGDLQRYFDIHPGGWRGTVFSRYLLLFHAQQVGHQRANPIRQGNQIYSKSDDE